jgi:hypothetical protein
LEHICDVLKWDSPDVSPESVVGDYLP